MVQDDQMGSLPRVHASEQMAPVENEPRLHTEAPQLASFETRPWPPTLIQFVPIGDYRSKFMGAGLRVAYAFAQCVQKNCCLC
jgi:hypothetical protein